MIDKTKLWYYLYKMIYLMIIFEVVIFVLKYINVLPSSFNGNILAWIYIIPLIPGLFVVYFVYIILGLDINNQMTEASEAIGIIINICLYLIVKEKKMKYLKNDKK